MAASGKQRAEDHESLMPQQMPPLSLSLSLSPSPPPPSPLPSTSRHSHSPPSQHNTSATREPCRRVRVSVSGLSPQTLSLSLSLSLPLSPPLSPLSLSLSPSL